jgi:hypothetical protein
MTHRGSRVVLHLVGMALACIASGATPARAQAPQLTTAQVAADARAILVARVLAVDVRQEGGIYTYVELQTVEAIKGDLPATFTYRMLGGKIGTRETASGDPLPVFTAGEEMVLFLGQGVSQAGYPNLYRRQIFRVSTLADGTRVINSEPTGMAITRASGGPALTTTRPVRLADFIHSLKQLR